MYKGISLCFFLLFIFQACKHPSKEASGDIRQSISIPDIPSLPFAEWAGSAAAIPMGYAEKTGVVSKDEHRIIPLETGFLGVHWLRKEIWLCDADGSPIRRIGTNDGSPGSHGDFYDVWYHKPKKEIWVLSPGKRIVVYDLQGPLLRSMQSSVSAFKIALSGEDVYLYSGYEPINEGQNYMLWRLSPEGELREGLLPIPKGFEGFPVIGNGPVFHPQEDGSALFVPQLGYEIFRIATGKAPERLLELDFGSLALTTLPEGDLMSRMMALAKRPYLYLRGCYALEEGALLLHVGYVQPGQEEEAVFVHRDATGQIVRLELPEGLQLTAQYTQSGKSSWLAYGEEVSTLLKTGLPLQSGTSTPTDPESLWILEMKLR